MRLDKYKVELWYKGRTRIGNIRSMTENLRWTKKRNGVYSIDFSLDLKQFDEYCKRIGEVPSNVLSPLLTDVRIKVRDRYIVGANVISDPPNFNQSDGSIQVSCDGFLGLTGRRRITKNYSNMYTGNIVKDALEVVQSEPNGDLGIEFHPDSYLGAHGDRQFDYLRQNIKELIENRAVYVNDPFDFEFAPDRTLRLYSHIGEDRTDTIINYPANPRNDIGALSMTMEHTGVQVANRIIAVGSGIGEEALVTVANDLLSQQKYGIIEDEVVFNDVSVLSTLETHAYTELRRRKEILVLPSVVVSGDKFKTDEYSIGDRVIINQNKYDAYKTTGYYRIEEMSVSVDENDHEDVTLKVDNYEL